jgi:2-polyprenyl-6-methoxyphenol hydroxylase-like FAD-dependent oxidoreductase
MVLESVLLERAREYAAVDLRFGEELLELEQNDYGVTAKVRERSSNIVTRVQAEYVVGADGAHSTVRDILGIDMIGPKAVSQALSILFKGDLGPYVHNRPVLLCLVHNPEAPGMLAWTGTTGRWCFNAHFPEVPSSKISRRSVLLDWFAPRWVRPNCPSKSFPLRPSSARRGSRSSTDAVGFSSSAMLHMR